MVSRYPPVIGSAMTTFWLDEKDGDDAHDGLSPETAVATWARLDELLHGEALEEEDVD